MAQFFIDRPIFAWVIAIMIMVAGGLAIFTLPIAQYPAIAPPAVTITASYPGASADALDQSVTQVIEQKMNGLDHLRYIASSSDSSGMSTIELTFEPGTDSDTAQVQVQNKLQLATPQLPQDVQRLGVAVAKSNKNFLLLVGFTSTDGSMSVDALSDLVVSRLQDPLSRVPGVGDIQAFGSQYAMQIWLDPVRLRALSLTPLDVSTAIQTQNALVSAGSFGATPAVAGQQLNATITAQTRLRSAEQFAAILVRVNPDGSQVRLRDVARVELTGESSVTESRYNDKPATAIGIKLAAGANALDTADAIKQRLEELATSLPPNVGMTYPVDATPFVRISIHNVIETLVVAVVLVFLVMLLFLQNVRATLIPTIAVPVVLLGTFGVLAVFGYSINVLTMFGMVLAIGLLVDDAIVVVENVERVMQADGSTPKEATRKSMKQISGALVGIAIVIAAVFVPMALFSGSVGVIYRQFSITVVSAMTLSVIVALSLTPALTSTLLRAGHIGKRRGLFGLFNRGFDRTTSIYGKLIGYLVRRKKRVLVVYLGIVAVMAALYVQLPTGFLPPEDQGQLFVQVLLPAGSTQEQTRGVMARIAHHLETAEHDSVEGVLSVTGFSFVGRGQNAGFAFVKLRPWAERGTSAHVDALIGRTMREFSTYSDAMAFAFGPPPISELGNADGFEVQLQDRGGVGHDALLAARNQLLGAASQAPELTKVRPGGLEDQPEYRFEIDQEKASALGLSLAEVNATLSTSWGGTYVNDFVDRGRTKRVYLRGDAPYRMQPGDLQRWYVRNATGAMVPFSAFATGHWAVSSPKLDRFNGVASMSLQGEPAPGVSSGTAIAKIEQLAKALPAGVGITWSGLAYEERLAGGKTLILYGLALLVVFLCLAALYESWSVPVAVLLAVPLGVLGAVGITLGANLINNVYFQVGLLATIALGAKNAILIVEFAKTKVETGATIIDAVLEASKLRLRPILMTSIAFMLGVSPLAVASGAGAGGERAIGIAIIGGVGAATVLGLVLVPVFFVLVVRHRPPAVPTATALPEADHA